MYRTQVSTKSYYELTEGLLFLPPQPIYPPLHNHDPIHTSSMTYTEPRAKPNSYCNFRMESPEEALWRYKVVILSYLTKRCCGHKAIPHSDTMTLQPTPSNTVTSRPLLCCAHVILCTSCTQPDPKFFLSRMIS
jgi:hypothetical protein